MADEKKPSGGFFSDMGLVVVGFVLLLILWFANGGPGKADLRGIFIHPLQPLGSGSAYGPQFATSTDFQYQNYPYQDYSNQ